eukprot:Hpha_TRINITY_DN30171_c0_g1::TRINITY_DN30171_c0_g1_i1::g.110750::m.110750
MPLEALGDLRRSCPAGGTVFGQAAAPREFSAATSQVLRRSYTGRNSFERADPILEAGALNSSAPVLEGDWLRGDADDRVFVGESRRRKQVTASRLLYSRQSRRSSTANSPPPRRRRLTPRQQNQRISSPLSPACRSALACVQQQRSRHGGWFKTENDSESVLDALERRLGNTSAGLSALHQLDEYFASRHPAPSGSGVEQVMEEQRELLQELIKNHMETFSALAEIRAVTSTCAGTQALTRAPGEPGNSRGPLSPPDAGEGRRGGRLMLASTHEIGSRYATPPIRARAAAVAAAAPGATQTADGNATASSGADGGEDLFPPPPPEYRSETCAGSVSTGMDSVEDDAGGWLADSDHETVVHHSGSDGDDEASGPREGGEWENARRAVDALVRCVARDPSNPQHAAVADQARSLLVLLQTPVPHSPLPPQPGNQGNQRAGVRALDPDLVCGTPSDEVSSPSTSDEGLPPPQNHVTQHPPPPGAGGEDLMPLAALASPPPPPLDGGTSPTPGEGRRVVGGEEARQLMSSGTTTSLSTSASAEEGDCECTSVNEDKKAEVVRVEQPLPPGQQPGKQRSPLVSTPLQGRIVTPRSSLRKKRGSRRSPHARIRELNSPQYANVPTPTSTSAAGGAATAAKWKSRSTRRRQQELARLAAYAAVGAIVSVAPHATGQPSPPQPPLAAVHPTPPLPPS